MIVTTDNIDEAIRVLTSPAVTAIAFDTETTGIRPYHGSAMFSLICCANGASFYFNFIDYPDEGISAHLTLDKKTTSKIQDIFSRDIMYIAHNIKFDLSILRNHNITVGGILHDTMVMERILDNTMSGFSLDATAKRYDMGKDDAPALYIKANPKVCTDTIQEEYKRTETKLLKYYKIPFEIIHPYGVQDAEVTHAICAKQLAKIYETDMTQLTAKKLHDVYLNERRLSRTVYNMESLGVRLDVAYCKEALGHDQGIYDRLERTFQEHTGRKYEETMDTLSEVFKDDPPTLTYITKARSFEAHVLEAYDNPMARVVLDLRKYKKKIDSLMGMLYNVDEEEILHTQLNQHIPWTGRFSSSSPNLQNMKKSLDEDDIDDIYPIRRAIIPREGKMLYMLDYEQMEYRMMLDYAKEMPIIRKVLDGLDVHQATADQVGIDRFLAKTANFAILYGAGINTLARQTGLSYKDAKELKENILDAAPKIEKFIAQVKAVCRERKFIINWLGRRYKFPDPKWHYKSINTLIQGGTADVVKVAMNRVDDLIHGTDHSMLLSIHDELVIEAPTTSGHTVIEQIKHIMETVYPAEHLPLTVSVEHSYRSLADKVEGYAAGNKVQNESSKRP